MSVVLQLTVGKNSGRELVLGQVISTAPSCGSRSGSVCHSMYLTLDGARRVSPVRLSRHTVEEGKGEALLGP